MSNEVNSFEINGKIYTLQDFNLNDVVNYASNKLNDMLSKSQIPKLLFAGDSLTKGYGKEGYGSVTPFPELIKEYIDENYGVNITVLNKGIGGELSSHSLSHFDSYLSENPDIIFWMFGTNDISYDKPINEIASNLINFYKKCVENDIELVVILPPRRWDDRIKEGKTRQLCELYRSVCNKLGIIYVDTQKEMELYLEGNSKHIKDYIFDGVHYNGYEFFSNIILKTLLSSIKNINCELNANVMLGCADPSIKTNFRISSEREEYPTGLYAMSSIGEDAHYEFTFYNSYPIYLSLIGYESNSGAKGIFLIDEDEFVVNQYGSNTSYTNSNFNRYYKFPKVILPGIHKLKFSSFDEESIGTTIYIGGFIFTKATYIDKMPIYGNNILFKGTLSSGTGTLTNGSFKDSERIILHFSNNDYSQVVNIPLIRKSGYWKQLFDLYHSDGSSKQCRIDINLNGNTFSLVNTSDYNLIAIYDDVGNQKSPYNY